MKEIKFRAWDKQNKKWLNQAHTSIHLDGKHLRIGKYDPEYNCSVPVEDLNHLWVDRLDLTQFTGLKDKNGKMIFAGDIVRRVKKDRGFEIYDPSPVVSEIFYDKAGFFVKGIANMDCYLGAVHEKIEVIGNIYENPELLEDNAKV